MVEYLFIILDRYDSSESKTITFKSKMQPLQAFRFAYLENVEEDDEFFEDEIYPNLRVNENLVAYDLEEQSFLLINISKK